MTFIIIVIIIIYDFPFCFRHDLPIYICFLHASSISKMAIIIVNNH